MALSTKEPAPLAEQASDAAPLQAQGKQVASPARPNAVCMEIPIVVQGSRYTSLVRNRSEHIEPFREETHTMIVFPGGAVVRLSAKVEPGEMVLVTNQKNGQQLMGRVVDVKIRETVKGHAEIEFTQRALGFWGINFPQEAWNTPLAPLTPAVESEPPARESSEPGTAEAAMAALDDVESLVPGAAPPLARNAESPAVILGSLASFDAERAATRSGRKVLVVSLCAVLGVALVGGAILGWRYRGAMTSAPVAPQAVVPAVPGQLAADLSAPPKSVQPAPATTPANAAQAQANALVPPDASKNGQFLAGPQAAGLSASALPQGTKPAEQASRRVIVPGKLAVPKVAPLNPAGARIEAPPVMPAEVPGITSGKNGNVLNSIVSGGARSELAPPPPKSPVHVGGLVKEPRLLSSVRPVYPQLAKQRGVEGDVTVDVVIDRSGKVTDMKVVSGHALLQQAAIEALRQWKYEPPTLDGQPVSMKMLVTVRFRIHQ